VLAVIVLTSRIFACALIAVLTLAVPALGAEPPPSAFDEYTETVPGAGGDHDTNDHDPGGGGSGQGEPGQGGSGGATGATADNVAPATLADLQDAGAEGAAAARLAQATAPTGVSAADAGTAGGDRARDAASDGVGARADDSRGGIGQVVSALTGGSDSSGMGIAFPLIMLVAFIVAVVIAGTRLRTRYNSST
jgi:hypothetical protein